jgi:2-polyprenyl-3-methyl-5-hydroxy-6-metoxy-1,4-benzoquinol methylase
MKTKNIQLVTALLISSTVLSQHNHHNHKSNDSTKTANEYMHQSSTNDLIKQFESAERDAYQQPQKVLEYLGPLKDKKIMDIGAGSGYFSVKLADKGANVIAADVSEEFQTALKKRVNENKFKNIQLRKIAYDDPGLENNEVDMVLIVNTYHHIENRSEYFAKVKKGIKPNGELVIIDFYKTVIPVGPPVDHKISIDEVIAELKKAGYKSFEVNVDLLLYQYIIKAK